MESANPEGRRTGNEGSDSGTPDFWDDREFLPLKLTVPLVNDDVPISFPRRDHRHYMLGERSHDIEDIAFVRIQHALHGPVQVFLFDHALALDSESTTELDIIGIDSLSISRIAQERMTPIGVVEPIFPLHHHAKMLVVDNDDLGGDPFHMGAG